MEPKIEYLYDEIRWDVNGIAFRKNGPCYITRAGDVRFSQIDIASFNRKNGPSLIRASGRIEYADNNSWHRTDGPAIIHEGGNKEYWVYGIRLSPDEFFFKFGVL